MNENYNLMQEQASTPEQEAARSQTIIYTQPTPAPKKKRTGLKITALALCCALLGGIAGAGGTMLVNHKLQQESAAEPETTQILIGNRDMQPLEPAQIDTNKLMSAAEVYAVNVNSTVGITTSISTNYFGYTTTSAASGSGFILTSDGYILTNYHVIEESSAITVTLYDGTTYEAALIGYDESLDTAILKVEAEDLVPVVLGNSDQLMVGDDVVAIGNPLGELTFSLTSGTVSALDREITMSNSVTMDLIQTDCAINSGNSGGALFNLYGEVIGITNAKYSGNGSEASIDNIGFAIPINDVLYIVESIIEKGYVSKPYIGVSVSDVSAESQSYGLPMGAAIRALTEDAPAAQAGLQVNDIITHVGETPITGSDDLVDQIGLCQPGDTLNLTVYRQGETLKITLNIGEQIQSAIPEKEAEQAMPQGGTAGGPGSFPFPSFGYSN